VKPARPEVHVAVPTYGNSPAICQLSFGSFIGHGVSLGFIRHIGEVDGAYIDRARNDLVRQAMSNGATHICWIDQDMIVPEGALKRLLDHEAEWVGGIYFGKDDYFTPVAFHLDPFRRVYEFDELPMVNTPAELVTNELAQDGVLACVCGKTDNHAHEVGGTGMGITVISVDLFRRMEEYFTTNPCPCNSPGCEPQRWYSSREQGEDVHLALRAKAMGIQPLLDGFVQAGHVRNQIVTFQHYEWARQNAPRCVVCDRVAFFNISGTERCFKHQQITESGDPVHEGLAGRSTDALGAVRMREGI
jgi:hypothetical protein